MGLPPSDPPYYVVWVGFLLLPAFSFQSETRYLAHFSLFSHSLQEDAGLHLTVSHNQVFDIILNSSHQPFIAVCPVLLNKLSICFCHYRKNQTLSPEPQTSASLMLLSHLLQKYV